MKIITFCHDSISYRVPDALFEVFQKYYFLAEMKKTNALMEFIKRTYKPIITDLMITDEGFSETEVIEHLIP